MHELPLVDGIVDYVKKDNISFCMPGHKGGRGFYDIPEGKTLFDNILKADITEVEGVDNLHNAEGIIKKSGELLSRYYGSRKSYFLVNGSTLGNMIMIFSSFEEGDKILVERNCHRSIINAIILRKLKPVYIKDEFSKEYNAPLTINEEHFYKIIDENKDAKGIIFTYPNYYGMCCNLSKLSCYVKQFGMKVLVDSAHGAHFGVCKRLPHSAVDMQVDMVVNSAHKTLPSLTQTAYLHFCKNSTIDIDKVDFYFSALSSTSPSYIFLTSMDYARFYMEKYGEKHYNNLIDTIEEYIEKINKIDNIKILTKEDFESTSIHDMDKTRMVINIKKGYSGYKLSKYLKKCGIEVEMSDISNIILIVTPFNKKSDIEVLYNSLCNCNFDEMKDKEIEIMDYDIPDFALTPYEVMKRDKIKIKIDNSSGRICGENIVPYPPGVAIITLGEVINENIISAIHYYIENDVRILGVSDNEISVIK